MNLRCPLARAQGCTQLQQEYRPQMNLRCPLAQPQGCTQLQQEYRLMDPTPDLMKTSLSASPGYPQPLDLCVPSPGGSCNHRTIFHHFG
ncbi:hypothetical protein ACOMHN_060373 [Nucella lapillus]